jgi:undecaprenyl-diphosphatase
MNYFLEINHYISKALNNFVLNHNLESCIWISSDMPIFFLPIFLIITWIYWTYKIKNNEKKYDLLNIFYWVVLAIIINLIIQHFFFFERPETLITPILKHIPDASFPSDHAAVSFAFLTWLFLAWYKKIWIIFTPFVIIMNTSRIAWWVHWFFDIIAWLIIWILSANIIFKNKKILEKINKLIIKLTSYIKL